MEKKVKKGSFFQVVFGSPDKGKIETLWGESREELSQWLGKQKRKIEKIIKLK